MRAGENFTLSFTFFEPSNQRNPVFFADHTNELNQREESLDIRPLREKKHLWVMKRRFLKDFEPGDFWAKLSRGQASFLQARLKLSRLGHQTLTAKALDLLV